MERKKKSYNLLTGIIALVAIVTIVALVGYIVSKPEPTGSREKFRAVWKSFMPAKAISYTRVTLS